MANKYYSPTNILKKDAHYNLIIGERSNGKTYSILKIIIEKAARGEGQGGIIRRWAEDIRGSKAANLFTGHVINGVVTDATDGEYTNIHYNAGAWYFSNWDETLKKNIDAPDPFAYAFSISQAEHFKSLSFPNITTVCFDEFLTRQAYIVDEFIQYINLLSTIIRDRNNVKIFMLGNTVNQYSPYFVEMGLRHISKMKKGDIDIYTYGDSGLKVAVEFSDNPNKGKASDTYFAFDNPRLSMITGKGQVWELAIYPHITEELKYSRKQIKGIFFIDFDEQMLQCEIVKLPDRNFIAIHRKTTPLRDKGRNLIYSCNYDARPHYRRRITRSTGKTPLERYIVDAFQKEHVFYQDNEVGEIVRNYIQWSKTA